MHGFRVAAAAEELGAHAESEARDDDASFHTPSELVELGAVVDGENPDNRSLFRGSCQFQPVGAERQRCQRTVVSRDHGLRVLEREQSDGRFAKVRCERSFEIRRMQRCNWVSRNIAE